MTKKNFEDVLLERQDQVRKFLLGLIDLRKAVGVKACAMILNEASGVSTVRNGGCHASFGSILNPIVTGGGFMPTAEMMDIAEKFWAFITDKEKSPWKMLMQNGIELVIHPDDGLPIGWILPYETVKNTPFYLQKNFCILTRVFTEKHKQFIIWDKLVKKGVPPADAFYLCSLMMPTTVPDGFAANNQNLSGAHWPLTDYFYEYPKNQGYTHPTTNKKLDFKAYRSGELIDNDQQPGTKGYGNGTVRDQINGYFQEVTPSDREVFNLEKYCTLKTSGGSFSQLKYYEIDDVIDGFYKWQDQEGILCQ